MGSHDDTSITRNVMPADPSPYPRSTTMFSREPVITMNALAALATAVIAGLAYAFGWSEEAVGYITAISAAVFVVLSTLIARSKVTPVDVD